MTDLRYTDSTMEGPTTGRIQANRKPDFHQFPKAPAVTNPTDRIKQAEAELAAAIKEGQEAAERQALSDRFDYDRHLAEATISLISRARGIRTGNTEAGAAAYLARFRKELQPLAESYGVKIVLVGDKTTATVVLA